MLANAAISAALNVVILAGIPFLVYYLWHRLKHKRRLGEVAQRAGLQVGDPRYIWYCAALAVVSIAALLLWSPPLESFTGEGSPQQAFVGLGLLPDSLGAFLIERYALHVVRWGRVGTVRVRHAPFPLRAVEVESVSEDLLAAAGIERPAGPPLAHFSDCVNVEVRLGGAPGSTFAGCARTLSCIPCLAFVRTPVSPS